jgi:hypothetical protein
MLRVQPIYEGVSILQINEDNRVMLMTRNPHVWQYQGAGSYVGVTYCHNSAACSAMLAIRPNREIPAASIAVAV